MTHRHGMKTKKPDPEHTLQDSTREVQARHEVTMMIPRWA